MYDYEDYYDETSEFERQIMEFKDGLARVVKKEHQEEMERLREENAELQIIKDTLTEIRAEHNEALRKLDAEKQRLKRTALINLLDETRLVMFIASAKYIEKPKCNKCNDNRRIDFVSPSGRKQQEDCLCKACDSRWEPAEALRYEFCQRSCDGRNVIAWYKTIKTDEDHICISEYDSGHVRKCYDGKPYEEVLSYDVMFKTIEECQKYCDWLNERDKNNG